MILTAVAAGVAHAVHRNGAPASQRPGEPLPPDRVVAIWLAVVAAALLLVGVVSDTVLRHVVQIAPLGIALALPGRPGWRVNAAAPLLAFWLLVMGAIWLFFLGLARIVSGTFTATEIVLTIVIGTASLLGLIAVRRCEPVRGTGTRIVFVVTFALMQFAALALSTHPSIAGR
jgi:hypothetical protein